MKDVAVCDSAVENRPAVDSFETPSAHDASAGISPAVFETPEWFRALTLAERAASLPPSEGAGAEPAAVDWELAERRARRWREQAPFMKEPYLSQRLATDHLSESQFLRLLGEPVESWRRRAGLLPEWLAEYKEAFASFHPAPQGAGEAAPGGEATAGEAVRGLMKTLVIIEPLIRRAVARLRDGVETLRRTHYQLPFDPDTAVELIFEGFGLADQLIEKLTRTMILELNVARLEGLLQGETPRERFESFLGCLRSREVAVGMLREYPVLARQLVVCADNWVSFGLGFLQQLCADWDAIRSELAQGVDPGLLIEVQGGAGDTHRGGRSVVIAKFSSGWKLVYKPHSLAVDVHWGGLLAWLNERGDHPPLRALRCIDRRTYGWVEFVSAEGCESADEVTRFYRRQGGYLALLYALEGVDFHCENLIAAGEHPVLIDMEALFHPNEIIETEGLTPAEKALNRSVMSVGLLPQRIWGKGDSVEGVDLSGLGGESGQVSPDRALKIVNAATDEMRMTLEQFELQGSQNRPRLGGAESRAQDYADAIAEGFASVYRTLLKHRAELLATDGPLLPFDEDEVRAILRPTRTYALLLQDSFHPDVLRDALDRTRLFDRLWVEVEQRPRLSRVIAAECADLERGDIPLLTSRPASRHLFTSKGEVIPDFFDRPAAEVVRQRVGELSEVDLARQLWFVRASLATLTIGGHKGAKRATAKAAPPVKRGRLLEHARAVGDRLSALALHDGDLVSWLGLTCLKERVWTVLPMGTDLYDGLPGVAMFLAYLGRVTGHEGYTGLAKAASATMLKELGEAQPGSAGAAYGVGAFGGVGGNIYALTHLAALWDEPRLLAEAESLVELLPAMLEQDETLDVIGGAAGCILALCGLHRATSSPRALVVAAECGERLLARARPMEVGVGWDTVNNGAEPLTGFSHGAAGIAAALLELSALTGGPRFRRAALAAVAYERSKFSPEHGNWYDLRRPRGAGDGVESACMTAWCHGAPGIGMGRLRCLSYLDDTKTRGEIDAALRATLAGGFGYSHCLCHGDLGNLELLLERRRRPGGEQYRAPLRRVASEIVHSIEQSGWLCGTPSNTETPGFMLGLAGIGYSLLRLAEPGRVPSVLSLAPPPHAQVSTPRRRG